MEISNTKVGDLNDIEVFFPNANSNTNKTIDDVISMTTSKTKIDESALQTQIPVDRIPVDYTRACFINVDDEPSILKINKRLFSKLN